MYTIDLSPLVNEVLSLAAMVLSILGTYLVTLAISYIRAKTGAQINISDAAIREKLNGIVATATAAAQHKLADSGVETVTTSNEMISIAADTVIKHAPEVLAKLNITPEHVEDLIRAHVQTSAPATAA